MAQRDIPVAKTYEAVMCVMLFFVASPLLNFLYAPLFSFNPLTPSLPLSLYTLLTVKSVGLRPKQVALVLHSVGARTVAMQDTAGWLGMW